MEVAVPNHAHTFEAESAPKWFTYIILGTYVFPVESPTDFPKACSGIHCIIFCLPITFMVKNVLRNTLYRCFLHLTLGTSENLDLHMDGRLAHVYTCDGVCVSV